MSTGYPTILTTYVIIEPDLRKTHTHTHPSKTEAIVVYTHQPIFSSKTAYYIVPENSLLI